MIAQSATATMRTRPPSTHSLERAYDADACFYNDVNGGRTDDIEFYKARAASHTAVLELACGSGRVAAEIADAGTRCCGVDLSSAMLAIADEHRDRRGIPVTTLQFVRGDMRTVALEAQFDLCLCAYNSFQHMVTLEDQLAVFETVRRHLTPDGLFVFDVLNPDFHFLQPVRTRVAKMAFVSTELEVPVTLYEDTAYDRATQVNHLTYSYERADAPGGSAPWRQVSFDMRQFFPRELDLLIAHAGFEIIEKLGTFAGAPFEGCHGSQIITCRPH